MNDLMTNDQRAELLANGRMSATDRTIDPAPVVRMFPAPAYARLVEDDNGAHQLSKPVAYTWRGMAPGVWISITRRVSPLTPRRAYGTLKPRDELGEG